MNVPTNNEVGRATGPAKERDVSLSCRLPPLGTINKYSASRLQGPRILGHPGYMIQSLVVPNLSFYSPNRGLLYAVFSASGGAP